MRIVWSPDYELGILLIDQQHRRIVDYINDLDRLAGQPDAQLGVARVLYDLVDYTESHFSFEEALMERAGYEDLDNHHHLHRKFTFHIESLMRRHEEGKPLPSRYCRCWRSGCCIIFLKRIVTIRNRCGILSTVLAVSGWVAG